MADGATLVLTDTNAFPGQRWGSLRDNLGQVDQPGVTPLASDPSDYALPVFPGAGDDSRTVAEVTGVASVRATGYGDPLTYTPENRPFNAVDGDPATAWTCCAHSPAVGQTLQINLDQPVTANHVSLLQAQLQQPNRRITTVTLRFDGSNPQPVKLTGASYRSPGQTVSFPARTFRQLDITIDRATGGADKRYDGLAQVGFAEIGIPGVGSAAETLRLPTDLLQQAGPASLGHALYILMTRSRAIEPPRHDPEPTLARTFTLPAARSFAVGGTAEINPGDSDYLINQLIGVTPPGPPRPGAGPGPAVVVAANSSSRLDEDRQARANAAVDANPGTAWVTETGPQAGQWLSLTLNKPITIDHLDLQLVNDGRHSLPTRITISTPAGSRVVDVPRVAVGNGRAEGSTTSVPVSFAALTGSAVKLTIDAVRQVRALDYYATFTGATDILPVGIAELGLPVVQPPPPAQLPSTCQAGLLRIDGKPVDVEITGTTTAALAGQPLTVRGCGNAVDGMALNAGPHVVQTSPRLPSGWSIDTLNLTSAPGAGGSGWVRKSRIHDAGGARRSVPLATSTAPALHVDHQNRTSWTVTVDGNGRPFWLVFGQSQSAGWTATLPGGRSLGSSQLVDGYANGWYMPAGAVTGPTVIHLTWTPQRVVWAAIGVSAAALVGVTLVAVWPGGRRRRRLSAKGRRPRGGNLAAPPGRDPLPVSWAAVAAGEEADPGPDRWRPRPWGGPSASVS